MSLPGHRDLLEATAELTYCNPFLRERVALERRALGRAFEHHGEVWHPDELTAPNPNVVRIQERLETAVPAWRSELLEHGAPSREELRLYRDVVYYTIYNRWQADLLALVLRPEGPRRVALWTDFEAGHAFLLPPELQLEGQAPADLVFAWFFQLRRAFHHVFHSLHGSSRPVAELRAQVWQSIFSHDMRRFRRGLYSRIGDFTTLITGPSGTGKELVARAIGMSRFIPFDPRRAAFVEDFRSSFIALNLAALSPTLVESELFGHRKGSFTGAIEDRKGWLETCSPLGSVFLDEIGEISLDLQVKLLRVLQTRAFQRIGDTTDRRFEGKLIASTHRDPEEEMRAGRMRPDFYYRICSDLVATPSLRRQLAAAPEDLASLVQLIVTGLVGDRDVASVTAEILDWIESRLGVDYAWPGNFRELEQCVRNLLIRGSYEPAASPAPAASTMRADLASEVAAMKLDAEALLRRYTTLVYFHAGSFVGAARRLGFDRRTVKARIDPEYLARLRAASEAPSAPPDGTARRNRQTEPPGPRPAEEGGGGLAG
ncbi:MAG: sigma 54-interacting transcriptional regulator [Acidobacteriota bacterium]|nr:sigma 54-interacting transcriptional regulator [Acidobacteriota bacterium]MDH3522347.1 sigma 54-interacting transcriptional regulator [Acidobacteriota bacterium]